MNGAQDSVDVFPFFDELPEGIRGGCSSPLVKDLIKYFKTNSLVARLLMENPGTFKMCEIMYAGQDLQSVADKFFTGSLSAQALKNRLEAVVVHLVSRFRSVVGQNGGIKVVNLGCGSSRDLIVAVEKIPEIIGRISAECVDIDAEALEMARTLTEQKNISSRFQFNRVNLTQLPHQNDVDVGLLVGVLCAMDHHRCVALLRKIRRYFKRGGIVIASNASTEMVEQQKILDRVLRDVIGWELVYKTTQELQGIFEEAGYRWLGHFYDEPTRFHTMGIGVVE